MNEDTCLVCGEVVLAEEMVVLGDGDDADLMCQDCYDTYETLGD